MQSTRTRFLSRNPFKNATVFTVSVILPLPILLFSTRFPSWLPILALAILLLIFFLRGLANGRFLGTTPADFPLYILLLLIPINLWATPDTSVTLPRTYALIANIALFWAVSAQNESRWLPLGAWALLVVSLGLSAIVLFGTNFTGVKFPFVDQSVIETIPNLWRPFWNTSGMNPNLGGGLLALFWFPAFVFLLKGPGWILRLAGGFTTVILTSVLLLAQSRGALLGILITVMIVSVLVNWRWLFLWLGVGIAAVFVLPRLLPGISFATLFEGGANGGPATLTGRLEIWGRTVYMIEDFPFTGVGQGMVEPVIDILYPLFLISPEAVFQHAHNIYLQTAAEMGLPALVALLAFFLVLLFLSLKRWRLNQSGIGASLTLGLLGALIVFLIHGFVEVITYAPRGAIIVWGLFGLLVAVTTSHALIGNQD